MATKNGYRALGLSGGEIRPGEAADLALFDTNSPALVPLGDHVAALAYAGSGLRARAVLVDGRLVWNDGQSTLVDTEKVLFEARQACARLGM